MNNANSDLFDTADGSLSLPNGSRLRGGMAAVDVTHASNLSFVREIKVGTGWIYRTTSPFDIQGHTVQFGPGFNDELLRDAAFSFNDLSDLPAANRRETHDQFLASMLGVPSSRTPAATTYKFRWAL